MTEDAKFPRASDSRIRRANAISRATEPVAEGGDVDENVLGTAFLVSPYAQFILDWSGKILVCNRRAERTYWPAEFGLPDEIRGKPFHTLTRLPPLVVEQRLREGTAAGSLVLPMRSNSHLQTPDGTVFRVSLLRSASRGERLILLTQDQLKATAQALTKMNNRRIEVHEELERLGSAHIELQSAMASMEAFSRAASHDLKTPLNTLTVALELLDAKFAADLPDTVKEYHGIMQKAVGQMDRMTSELLQHARSKARFVAAEPLNLRREVEEVCRDMSIAISECGGECHIRGAGFDLMAEPLLFRLLMSNLLTNAIKYRHGVRPLRIDIDLQGDTSGEGRVVVKDNGTGFDPKKAREIFVPFNRLESVTDGTGLGLSTCAEICRRHGWEIFARGVAGQTASFIVDFNPSAM